jgi:hypothetical protein
MYYVIAGLLGLVVLGGLGAFLWWWRSGADDPRQVADKKHPRRRFAQGIMFILSRGHDYGYSPPAAARGPLNGSWDIHDGAAAIKTIKDLANSTATAPAELAFDLVRAVNVARLAAGAEYISQEQSFALVDVACRRLQAGFQSFEQIGELYAQKAAEWCRENGITGDDTQQNVNWCREFEWPEIPFQTP